MGLQRGCLRSLSALASILCVPVAYLLGREFGRKGGREPWPPLRALCPMSVYFACGEGLRPAYVGFSVTLGCRGVPARLALVERGLRGTCCPPPSVCISMRPGCCSWVACAGAVWLWLLRKGAAAKRARWKWVALNGVVLMLGVPYYLHVFAASQTGIINYVPAAGIQHHLLLPRWLWPVALYPWPGTFGGCRVPRPDRLALAKPVPPAVQVSPSSAYLVSTLCSCSC